MAESNNSKWISLRSASSSPTIPQNESAPGSSPSLARKNCQTIFPRQFYLNGGGPSIFDRFNVIKMASQNTFFCETAECETVKCDTVKCQMAAPSVSLPILNDVSSGAQDVLTDVGLDTAAVDSAVSNFRHRMRRWVRGEGPNDGAIAGVNFGHAASAALGGPMVIYGYTPLRNAMTLGAQDKTSSALRLYGQLFSGGMFKGWTGGFFPGVAAVPQFMILGPFFHLCRQLGLGTAGAVLACGAAETVITFGSQTRNAQLAYLRAHPEATLPKIQHPAKFWGVGAPIHIIRNSVALSGFRLVSGHIREPFEKITNAAGVAVSRSRMNVMCDFTGCLCSAVLSAPINQSYNYIVTTPKLQTMPLSERLKELRKYLRGQYLGPNGRITAVVVRDLTMRCVYVASAFSTYGFIERETVHLWRGGAIGW